ncbi:DUF4097 domain-containing protein [Streptomyces sp. NPDC006879]|uniref:DUF4097 family beta strand repeat-containing protein n=1 Tax=Streptomyces sp. NPDC006879 TaxID=3364767 RepID=UPI00369292EC
MTESTWTVAEPHALTFEEPVTALSVRIVQGAVNVVGVHEGPARLEVSDLDGPPLIVTQRNGTLTVAYEDLPWQGFLNWLEGKSKGARRSATVSLAVPAGTRVEVGVVGAGAVVSGIDGSTEVRAVTGDLTLVGLTGTVRADTVSGNLEAQSLTGQLRFHSVSGDLTVIDGTARVRAESVSGDMLLDLGPDPADRPADISLTSVSGELAVRLAPDADAHVEASTASGRIANDFDDLKVTGQWGAKRLAGSLGTGTGRLRAGTLSGSVALLRRPAAAEDPFTTPPAPNAPATDFKKVL